MRRDPQEPRALRPEDGHRGARPKALGGRADVPRENLGADQGQTSGGEHAASARVQDADDSPEVHQASESEATGEGRHPSVPGSQDDKSRSPPDQ